MVETTLPSGGAKRRQVLPVPLVAVVVVVVLAAVAGATWFAFGQRTLPAEDSGLAAARESLDTGDFVSAEEKAAALVAEDGDDLEARAALALALSSQGKNEDAIEAYAAIVEADPADHDTFASMAALEQLIGRATEAIEHYETAIEVSPQPSYYEALAPIYASVGKWTECIGAWTTYLELTELDPVAEGRVHAAMASAYEGMREYDKASAELEQALVLDPSNEDYQSRLESYAN